MTKDQFIELIKRRLAGGYLTPEQLSKISSDVIEYNVSRAFNQIFYEVFRQDSSNLDLYCKEYRNIDILYDTETDTYYSILPESIVQLPDPQNGVRRINLMQNNTVRFVPVEADSIGVFDMLDVSLVSDMIKFTVNSGKRIEYYNMNPDYTKVRMSLVIPFEKYEGSDDVYIPSGQELNLADTVIKLLLNQPDEKKLNDNSGKNIQ